MKNLFLLFFVLSSAVSFSQAKECSISGYVKEQGSGETLIGVNIYLKENSTIGTVSNSYGFYSLNLPEGKHELVFSYIGYNTLFKAVDCQKNLKLDVNLSSGITIEEVVITSEDKEKNIKSTEMGTVDVKIETIKKIPALMGEVDVMKALQLLPGVSSANEGSSGLYVRGGGPDQNLVLLDEAVVYNTGHLFGFFSVFNSDAIKNVNLIKGTMPANYGSRISSVIDVQMKEGNNESYVVEGGIGLISSRLTVQGPIQKNKSSFILSGRRTYALDIAQPFIDKTDFKGTNYFFYDFNAKANYIISRKDRVYLSGYFGRDIFKFANEDRGFSVRLPYGNATGTLRWNHLINDHTFLNVALISNNYNFSLGGGQEEFQFSVASGVRDYSLKTDIDYYPSNKHQVKFGHRYTYHRLNPNIVRGTNGEVEFNSGFKPKYGHENELYAMDEWKLQSNFKLNAGLRFSIFSHVGPYNSVIQNKEFLQGQLVKSYFVPEPRIVANYSINNFSSLKAGFTLGSQYIHLVSSSSSTLPNDIWIPSTEKIKPQIGYQYALGYFVSLFQQEIDISVETYYKDLQNQLDYKESYIENFSSELEDQFVTGRGQAYGIEFFVQKKSGRLNGWVGYTLSKTEKWFSEIENGRKFPNTYDRPHDLVIVANYRLNSKWDLSSSFIYATGRTYTPIKSIFIINNQPNIEYGPRNSTRLKPYHRADISLSYANPLKKKNRFHSSWVFSVYNVYNRKNPFFSYTDFESNVFNGNLKARAVNVSLFTIIPSVTWNFYWNSKKETK